MRIRLTQTSTAGAGAELGKKEYILFKYKITWIGATSIILNLTVLGFVFLIFEYFRRENELI